MTKEELTLGMLVQHILTKEGLIVINIDSSTSSTCLQNNITIQCRDTKMNYVYCSIFELEPYDADYHQRMRELLYKKKEKGGGEDYI